MSTSIFHRGCAALSGCKSAARKSAVIGAAALAAVLLGTSRNTQAANIVLTDENSSVTIDPTSTAGVENWTVNGQNQLNKEWFWFRSGSSGGQKSLDSLGTPLTQLFDTNGNGKDDTVMLTYGPSNGLQISVIFSLTGGQIGSDASDLTENITINNHGNTSVNYHFFEYANFNLGGSTTGQTVAITNSNTATDSGNGMQVQTVASPKASEVEANNFPSLLNHIASSTSYTLSGATSSTGDPEWGFEWDKTIPMCGSESIAVDNNFKGAPIAVPEPTSAVAMLGLGGLCFWRRRRRAAREIANA